MKLKKTIKFSLSNCKKALLVYYGILCASTIAGLLVLSFNPERQMSVGGLETTSIIFLFVMGLGSFRSDLYLFLQNGISRKTACVSYFISSAIMAGFMALIESISYTIIGRNERFHTAFRQIYVGMNDSTFILLILTTFAWSFFFYYASSIFGYFVATLYYRMNKTLKLIVSIGVPVSILFILPILDEYVANGAIGRFINKLALLMMGVSDGKYQPVNWMISCSILALIFAGLSYLLIKKAVIKSK